MARNSVFEWSATAASNTDVGGNGISGNDSPSGLDNGMREMMAQLKTFQTYLGITDTGNIWNKAQVFTSTSANPNITVERTGSSVNSHIGYKTDGGTLYAGMGASMTWAVGSSTNLSVNPWVALVSTGAMTLTGTAPSVLYNDTGGGVARTSGDSLFGSLFLEADINAGFANSVIGFKVDNSDVAEIDSTGSFKLPALGFSSTGARNGKSFAADIVDSSRNASGSLSHYRFYNTNGQVGGITTAASATTFATTSDGQQKINRAPLEDEIDVWAIIDALIPLAYDWLSTSGVPTGERGYGLIAQDVHEVWPMAVNLGHGKPGDPDYTPSEMDNSKYAVLLIAAVKSLKARVTTLEGVVVP